MKINQKSLIGAKELSMLEALGAQLKAQRIKHGYTQEAIAESTEMSRQTVARIERGDPSVALGQVMRFAQVVSFDVFTQMQTPEASPVTRVRNKARTFIAAPAAF